RAGGGLLQAQHDSGHSFGRCLAPNLGRHQKQESSSESRHHATVIALKLPNEPSAKSLSEESKGFPARIKPMNAEQLRLIAAALREQYWRRWGPYLAERAWGTVREDYSAGGTAWEYFPFEHSHIRAYRWGEDGIAGVCDNHQRLCFSVALWNERDAILKERLFGLSGNQGNHGEDVKECYYYLDSTPTHTYM